MDNGGPLLIALSADGVQIAHVRIGQGRPLVVVGGALYDHRRWLPVARLLSQQATVYVMDRRGRGGSGDDAATYAPEREVDDIAAVIAAAGGSADLLGHSSGALLAIQAAETGLPIRRLVLYEPPYFPRGVEQRSSDLPDRLFSLLRAGKPDDVVATFLLEGPRLPPPAVEARRGTPMWQEALQCARSLPYDSIIQIAFSFDTARLAELRIPTLLLLGGASPPAMRIGTDAIAEALPIATIVEMLGQEHIAMVTAPEAVADAVRTFLAPDH
ncbi:MAG: alpha/beta hydrolase [Chloroflexi bacterium]|nr:MAG: alpha/beta hydrolase [Chloroflexota bacterium]